MLNVVGNDMLTHWPAMELLKLERHWQRQIQISGQWHRQILSESSIRERSERLVSFKTFDQNDKETWPDQKKRQIQTQRQWQRLIHLENSIRERSERLVTFETFDQSNEETWPDQNKDKYKDKDKDKDKCI